MLGLVLTAGGARGAYQAGVLRRISEIPALRDAPSPFSVITGASAGAINGTALAARASDFGDAGIDIARLWSELRVEKVFRCDVPSLLSTGAALASDFVLGGLFGHTVTHGVFDTSPLDSLMAEAFPPRGIGDAIRRGHLYAVAVTATSYHSGRSYTFVQGRRGHPVWTKARRVVLPATLTHRHVMASSAIPILFPPVRVDDEGGGGLWFGDGALRLVAPMSPAIRLGAKRIVAVGVRSSKAAASLAHEEKGPAASSEVPGEIACPPLAQVCGVFFNAIFLDHLDADVEHLRRMNELLAHQEAGSRTERGEDGKAGPSEAMNPIEALVVSPSEDLALLAQRFAHRMPRLVRFVLDGLGIPDAQSADLMSYLLFDGAYTRSLVEIGWRDADARIDEIEDFIRSSPPMEEVAPKPPRRLQPMSKVAATSAMPVA